MITDSGYFSSGLTESFPAATPAVHFLLGRYGAPVSGDQPDLLPRRNSRGRP